MSIVSMSERSNLLRRGVLLATLTVAWNVVEGVLAVASGVIADSVALLAFGIDSFIETASAAVVIWRLRAEQRGPTGAALEAVEHRTAKIAGGLLLTLAAYVLFDAARRLLGLGEQADQSRIGMALTAVSLLVMPVLGRAKLQVAAGLGSGALRADAYETIACAWLSATTLAGLTLNGLFGWWWADPVAALILVPLIAREGREAWRGGCTCREE